MGVHTEEQGKDSLPGLGVWMSCFLFPVLRWKLMDCSRLDPSAVSGRESLWENWFGSGLVLSIVQVAFKNNTTLDTLTCCTCSFFWAKSTMVDYICEKGFYKTTPICSVKSLGIQRTQKCGEQWMKVDEFENHWNQASKQATKQTTSQPTNQPNSFLSPCTLCELVGDFAFSWMAIAERNLIQAGHSGDHEEDRQEPRHRTLRKAGRDLQSEPPLLGNWLTRDIIGLEQAFPECFWAVSL